MQCDLRAANKTILKDWPYWQAH